MNDSAQSCSCFFFVIFFNFFMAMRLSSSPGISIGTVSGSRAVHQFATDNIFLGMLSVTDSRHPPPGQRSWQLYGDEVPLVSGLFAARGVKPDDNVFAEIVNDVLRNVVPIPLGIAAHGPPPPVTLGSTSVGALLEIIPSSDFVVLLEQIIGLCMRVRGGDAWKEGWLRHGGAIVPREYGKLFADTVILTVNDCVVAYLDPCFGGLEWNQLSFNIPYFRSFVVFSFSGNGIRGLWELGQEVAPTDQ